MKLVRTPPVAASRKPRALKLVLKQNRTVKVKVEEAAHDLSSANDVVKKKIAEGETTLSAPQALAESERIETKVQECADELHEVNETLAAGINDLKQTEIGLMKIQNSLVHTETALAAAQEAERNARMRAMHDSTTGLPNRDLFDDRLTHAISLAERHDWTLAVMFLDLNRFKNINDTHGHAAGDGVVKEIAKRLSQRCRDEDTVCRNGGDEFLYLLINPQGTMNIERIAGALLKDIAQPIDLDDLQVIVTSSIGVAIYPGNGVTPDQLVRNADAAMYHAKKCKRGCAFFDAVETE